MNSAEQFICLQVQGIDNVVQRTMSSSNRDHLTGQFYLMQKKKLLAYIETGIERKKQWKLYISSVVFMLHSSIGLYVDAIRLVGARKKLFLSVSPYNATTHLSKQNDDANKMLVVLFWLRVSSFNS